MLTDIFFDCIKHDGIVSVASAGKDGRAHIANTWNKYLIVTDDEKILIPCFGFIKTERTSMTIPISKSSSEAMKYRARWAWARAAC